MKKRLRFAAEGLRVLFCHPIRSSPVPATQVHSAGGAFAVDDSEVGSPGECKVESWASFADNDDFIGATAPACVANLGRPVEFGAQIQRDRSDGEWGTGLTLKAKTNIIPLEGNRFGLGVSASTGWDLISGKMLASP